MKKVLSLTVILALCLSVPLIAEEEGAGPPKALDKEAFGWMLGEWEGFTEGPMGKSTDWMNCEMALDGQFVHMAYKSETAMGPFAGMGVLTLMGEEVRGYWVDSMRSMSEGKGHRDGNKMVMTWSTPKGDYTRITENVGDGKMVITAKMTENGQEMTFKCEMTRVKAAGEHQGHSH